MAIIVSTIALPLGLDRAKTLNLRVFGMSVRALGGWQRTDWPQRQKCIFRDLAKRDNLPVSVVKIYLEEDH